MGKRQAAVEPTVPVFVKPTKGDEGQFSDMLKVELNKRRGLIKANVSVVNKSEEARYVLQVSITYQRVPRDPDHDTGRPSALATALAHDQCGAMVWSKTKGDRNTFGDGHGAIAAARKMARSFKQALAKPNSRLNQAVPCVPGE